MNWQLLWFVLAGLVLGLALSTLWEWFYFRRERMIVRDERITELEAQLRAYERREREERMAAPPWTAPGYQSPDALLESEQIEETAVSIAEDDLVESSELFDRHRYPDDETDEFETSLVEDVVLPGAVLAVSAVDDAELGENPADEPVADEELADEELADEDRREEPTEADLSDNPQADTDGAEGEDQPDSTISDKILPAAVGLASAGIAAAVVAAHEPIEQSDDESEGEAVDSSEPSASPPDSESPESDGQTDTIDPSAEDDSSHSSEIVAADEEESEPDEDLSEESAPKAGMVDDGSVDSESADDSHDGSTQADVPDSLRFDTPVDSEEEGSRKSDKALTGAAVTAAGLVAAAIATDQSEDDEEATGSSAADEEETKAEDAEADLTITDVAKGEPDDERGEMPAPAQQSAAVESEPTGEPQDLGAESKVWKPEEIRGHPDNLSRVKGVGKVYRRRLYAAGVFTWHQLSQMSADEIREIVHPFVSADVDQWPLRAREAAERNGRVGAQYVGPPPDDLMEIRGIGANAMQRLYKGGIWSFPQLAASSPEELKAIIPVSPSGENIDYERWIEIAAELAQERDRH